MLRFPPLASPASVAPGLRPGRIHLWVARLDPPPERVVELARLLDPEETARAARFRFDIHRRRFTVGRGFQRSVLGAYLGLSPAQIEYVYGPKGKPALAARPADGLLEFNLSNSEELALLGISREAEIGVDVEHLRAMEDLADIATRFFSSGETATLLALPKELQNLGFFNCWTRKEAYLKAVGDGLSAPLNAFDVTLRPGEPARMLRLEGDARRADGWSLYHLEPAPGYLGAVAIEGGPHELQGWTWG